MYEAIQPQIQGGSLVDAVRLSCQCSRKKPLLQLWANKIHRYTIGQRIAREFSTKDRVFLCGDAAHTHSSGAAQGLNTGIHDAVNLGWKLALHIRAVTKPEVLRTYSSERLTVVNRLINYDKDISVLMSHKWPSWYTGDPDADPYVVLGEIFDQAASFNTGLGISYPPNVLNHASTLDLNVLVGARPPDVDLMMPGINTAIRFQRVTRNVARFWVVVYTGNPQFTKTSLLKLESFLETAKELTTNRAIGWITISPTVGFSPYEALGMNPFGNLYFDPTNVAHEKIGISLETGGVMVLRPDGLVSSAGHIDGPSIEAYFKNIMDL